MKNKFILFISLLFLIPISSNANIIILNGLSHVINGELGNTYKGVIQLKNTGDKVQNVKIYLNDYSYNSKGETTYSEPGSIKRSNSLWTIIPSDILSLNPKENYDLYYEVTIPKELKLSGSFASVLFVEPTYDINPNKNTSGVRLQTVIRYGIQLIVNVNETEAKSLISFQNAKITKLNKQFLLNIDLNNSGDLYHKIVVSAEFYDKSDGSKKGIYKSPLQSLTPDNSKNYPIDLSGLPPGDYKVILVADCGDDIVFGLNTELNIAND